MPRVKGETTYEAMLEARLRWALESTISHFLGKPDRNAIEDWAQLLAVEMGSERAMWQRGVRDNSRKDPKSPVDGRKDGLTAGTTN